MFLSGHLQASATMVNDTPIKTYRSDEKREMLAKVIKIDEKELGDRLKDHPPPFLSNVPLPGRLK